jgi:hypothetical protein
MNTTKPTLDQLTAKLQEIAAAMGTTAEPIEPGQDRYRLYLHVYLPSGLPLFFQSDRTGCRYDISISSSLQKINPVGWAKVSEVLEPTAWHENIYDFLDGSVTGASMSVSYDRPISAIVKAINSKLLKPEIVAGYEKGINDFVARKQYKATAERQLRELWDLCSHPGQKHFTLESDGQQISFLAPGFTRIHRSYQGFGVELAGLSEDKLKAVLAAADRLKANPEAENL